MLPISSGMGDLFGVAISPFELDEWQKATGITPDHCMIFEAWSKQRTLVDVLAKAKTFGHDSISITWEPWTPVPVGASADEQGAAQEEWSAKSILAGRHDEYIDNFARALRDSYMTVYLRYAHEMNGNWYPWQHDPAMYVAAWKYVRNRVRSMRAAWNVRFVWAPNPDLWRATPADWLQRLLPYWPGPAAVEHVGMTMIEFGAGRSYPIPLFAQQFELARQIFLKSVLAMEVNVAREHAIEWFDDLSEYITLGNHPLPLVVLSQGASRRGALGGTGNMEWSPMDDADAREAVKRVVRALHGSR